MKSQYWRKPHSESDTVRACHQAVPLHPLLRPRTSKSSQNQRWDHLEINRWMLLYLILPSVYLPSRAIVPTWGEKGYPDIPSIQPLHEDYQRPHEGLEMRMPICWVKVLWRKCEISSSGKSHTRSVSSGEDAREGAWPPLVGLGASGSPFVSSAAGSPSCTSSPLVSSSSRHGRAAPYKEARDIEL